MKERYDSPEIDIICWSKDDIITTSCPLEGERPPCPLD